MKYAVKLKNKHDITKHPIFRCACCQKLVQKTSHTYWMRYSARTKLPTGEGSMAVCNACAKKAIKLKIKTILKLELKLFNAGVK